MKLPKQNFSFPLKKERSLKSQIHAMEKKQHESWVTVRQEGRKIADAKNEMSTLRYAYSSIFSVYFFTIFDD